MTIENARSQAEPKRIFLSGIGGYAGGYVTLLLHPELMPQNTPAYALVGAADPFAKNSPHYDELIRAGVPVFGDPSEFFDNSTADLCLVVSPIQFHLEQTALAIRHGCNVLCEKPIAATLEQARQMQRLSEESGRFVGIGFQWSYSKEFKAVKRDILSGKLASPEYMRSMTLWPRDFKYYARPWAGKIRDAEGRPVYDSIANNATAHYLHIMLFALGAQMNRSVELESLDCQIYRANAIQNFDTIFMRATTKAGVPIYYYATHAGQVNYSPVLELKFANGDVTSGIGDSPANVTERVDGETLFSSTPDGGAGSKIREALCAIDGVNGVGRGQLTCDVTTAISHMKCIDAISRCTITQIPAQYIINDGVGISVPGMDDLVRRCYDERRLPRPGETPWITPTQTVTIDNRI